MQYYIDPEQSAFEALKALPSNKPIEMLNLISLRDEAQYEDGRKASGLEAYKTYGKVLAPILQRARGRIVWQGIPQHTLIGPAEEKWDLAFIVGYPSAKSFLDMVSDPFYQTEAAPHRRAAVLSSRLVCHHTLEQTVFD